jgi:hypothetical protein
MNEELLKQMLTEAIPPFYTTGDFWINVVLGVAGIVFSVLAFKEAAKAKEAAAAAGRSVKIQTVTIELTEILQRLDKLDAEIDFPDARDLLNEVSRRLRRLVGPFSDVSDISEHYTQLKAALKQAKEALEAVRPSSVTVEEQTPNAVYYALQGHFGTISEYVAEISGALEKKTITTEEHE